MKKTLYLILLFVTLLFTACDVHEFPVDRNERVPFVLHLDFSTAMPLYQEIVYTRAGEITDTKSVGAKHDVRYIVKAYRVDKSRENNREADTTFVFTKSSVSDLSFSVPLELHEGTYTFRVWADYVDVEKTNDKYYNTSDFTEIILANKDNHSGSNDYRDAYRGVATATVINPVYYSGKVTNEIKNEVTVDMERPMGKFKFVSTDVEIFVSRVVQMLKDRGMLLNIDLESDKKAKIEYLLQAINLGDFEVKFRYHAFMPCSFNMFTDKPADAWTGVSFTSQMYIENNNEMTMGFDYIFVNGSETTLSVSLEVYNKYGELISSTKPINVPVMRSKLTIVKGEFLSSIASEGVQIKPDFNGEYNVEIY